jgi:uncharacterized protein YjbI with pentapeptide repeats
VLSYDDLTPPERQLWDAFPEGRPVDLRPEGHDLDDPAEGERWGADRTVRAAVVAMLLLGAHPAPEGAIASLDLSGARITGCLDLTGADFTAAIRIEGCWFEQTVRMYGATTRTVRIRGSRVPGIEAALAQIAGRLDLRRSVIDGRLSLINARVGGELNLNGTRLRRPGDWALFAGGLVMEGAVFCDGGFTVEGGIRLVGAQLAGGLFMVGARLENSEGVALDLDNATMPTLALSDGFTAYGRVRLRGTRIAHEASFEHATLHGPVLDCTRMQAADLRFVPRVPPGCVIDLRDAQVSVLHEGADSWPESVRLEGFVYGSIQSDAGSDPYAVSHRVAWIRRTPGYAPQPYEQLADWYRRSGHDDDARRVLLAKQRHRRRSLRLPGRVWGVLLDATVGYGYRPWLAGLWLALLILLGTLVFHGAAAPTPVKPGEGPPFNAFVYTLDLLIPVGGLGQRGAWYWPGGGVQRLAYVLIAAGWLLTTAVVTGVTRSLSKN